MKIFDLKIAIAIFLLCISQLALANTVMHRKHAENLQDDGWHLAISSEGKFSVKLPCPFNDVTINREQDIVYSVACTDNQSTVFTASLIPPNTNVGVWEAFNHDLQERKNAVTTFKNKTAIIYSNPVNQESKVTLFRVRTDRGIFVLTAVYYLRNESDSTKFFQSLEFDADELLPLSPMAGSEVVKVKFSNQSWRISFNTPPLHQKQEKLDENHYIFGANSHRFNLSLFVETPANDKRSNKDCHEYYWSKGSKNPLIDQSSIIVKETDKYVRVQYDVLTNFRGHDYRLKNVNYYFVSHDKWVDIHISVIDPSGTDEDIFTNFDNSLAYD